MEYILTKNQILKAIVIKYKDIQNNILIPYKNPCELKYVEKKNNDGTINQSLILYEGENHELEPTRLILFNDHKFIDLETGDELFELPNSNGYIDGIIYQNQYYIIELLKCKVSDELLTYVTQVYEAFINRQNLIKQKNLFLFLKLEYIKKESLI